MSEDESKDADLMLEEDDLRQMNKLAGTKDLDEARKEERREKLQEMDLLSEEKSPSHGALEEEGEEEEEMGMDMDDMEVDDEDIPDRDEMGVETDGMESTDLSAKVGELVDEIADAIEEVTGVPVDSVDAEGEGVEEPDLEDPVDMEDGEDEMEMDMDMDDEGMEDMEDEEELEESFEVEFEDEEQKIEEFSERVISKAKEKLSQEE